VDLRCRVTLVGERVRDQTLAAVMGGNVKKLRGGHTQAELARHAKAWGLPWTTGTVANVEAGRSAPSLANLYPLVLALEDLLDRRVRPTELFNGSGTVTVGRLEIELRLLRTLLSDGPVKRPKPDVSELNSWMDRVEVTWPDRLLKAPYGPFHDTKTAMTESDLRIGKGLGWDADRTAAEMAYLWGHPLSVERDNRAASGANAQARGQISRQLKDELRKVITDGDD
jgi:hypothetical protein